MHLQLPTFWSYTVLEELERFIPPGFTRSMVVIKELLDNACDEAEKRDKTVFINLEGDFLTVKNKGVLTEDQLRVIIDFSRRLTSKYLKKSFQRGAVGHGLMIAIMLSNIDSHPVIIRSNEKEFTIKLINRSTSSPHEVLSLFQSPLPGFYKGEVEIRVALHFKNENERSEAEDFIRRYIIVNPHITFHYNGKIYEGIGLRKPLKYDIASYHEDELQELIKMYLGQNYKPSDIIDLFDVKKRKISQDSFFKFLMFTNSNNYLETDNSTEALNIPDLSDSIEILTFLRIFARPLKPFYYGRKALSKRINIINYKKILLNKNESIEIVATKDLKRNLLCINGSIVHSIFFEDKNKQYINNLSVLLQEIQKEKPISCLFIYHSPNLQFARQNKEYVVIRYDLTNIIKKFFKKISKKNSIGRKDWILVKERCQELAKKEGITKGWIQNKFRKTIHPWKYIFILKCQSIIEDTINKYGAVTIRQIYYQLISKGYISNTENSYSNLVAILTDAREMGIIDYFAFEDRSRYIIKPETVSVETDPKIIVRKTIDSLLKPPAIDIWEQQDYYLEIWIEKDALVRIFKNIADKYQITLYPSRGYSSLTKIVEAEQRFQKQIDSGKKVVILYFGDLDPSGWNIYEVIKEKFSNLPITVERVALNKDQTTDLIPMPLKKKDSRVKSFLQKLGLNECYELDALPPDMIFKYAEEAILNYFNKNRVPDTSAWNEKYLEIIDMLRKVLEKF